MCLVSFPSTLSISLSAALNPLLGVELICPRSVPWKSELNLYRVARPGNGYKYFLHSEFIIFQSPSLVRDSNFYWHLMSLRNNSIPPPIIALRRRPPLCWTIITPLLNSHINIKHIIVGGGGGVRPRCLLLLLARKIDFMVKCRALHRSERGEDHFHISADQFVIFLVLNSFFSLLAMN